VLLEIVLVVQQYVPIILGTVGKKLVCKLRTKCDICAENIKNKLLKHFNVTKVNKGEPYQR